MVTELQLNQRPAVDGQWLSITPVSTSLLFDSMVDDGERRRAFLFARTSWGRLTQA